MRGHPLVRFISGQADQVQRPTHLGRDTSHGGDSNVASPPSDNGHIRLSRISQTVNTRACGERITSLGAGDAPPTLEGRALRRPSS